MQPCCLHALRPLPPQLLARTLIPYLLPTVHAAYVEESLHRETARGKDLEEGWKATKAKLDKLLLDEGLDMVGAASANN